MIYDIEKERTGKGNEMNPNEGSTTNIDTRTSQVKLQRLAHIGETL